MSSKTFHSGSECILAKDGLGAQNRYSILSRESSQTYDCPGSVRWCPVLEQWVLHLEPYTLVTQGFLAKVWECLFVKLTLNASRSKMEERIRSTLRLVHQQCTSEDHLRDALTRIDEIIANETRGGN